MSADSLRAALQAEVDAGTLDMVTFPDRWQEVLDAEYAEERERAAAITPHLRRAPAKPMPRMSGPRYFNLMRAMEADPDEYTEYRPTTYCGAPMTTEDWDARTALSKTHAAAATERGVCERCLTAARAEQ